MRVSLPIVGEGSQVEHEPLHYMEMPRGMVTYRAPVLPEREEVQQLYGAPALLRSVLEALDAIIAGGEPAPVSLAGLSPEERTLVNQALGEGEVSAIVQAREGVHGELRVQESALAGVWRVLGTSASGPLDVIEVAPVPRCVRERAREDGRYGSATALPDGPGLMNAPSILGELAQVWRGLEGAGEVALPHVVNLTLLPVTPEDHAALDTALGRGGVTLLSRGYGNCRIESSARPSTWRLTYYNSQDAVILSTVEVCDVPEVACAAPQDFVDARGRLAELIAWLAAP